MRGGGSGPNVNFEGSVTLFYLCNLEPEEPDTSAFMAMDTVLVEFNFESQNAEFSILDAAGMPLDVLCSGDDPAELTPGTPQRRVGGRLSRIASIRRGKSTRHRWRPEPSRSSYTIQGDCGEVTEVQEVQVGLTPNVNTGNVGALCPFSEPVQLIGTPGGDAWSADCGGCVTPDGLFDPAVGAGMFAAEYTFGTVCTATGTVAVNVGEAVAANLEDLAYCESIGSVQLDDDGLAGNWSADCGGCVQASGTFTPPGPGTYVVSFMPGRGAGSRARPPSPWMRACPLVRPTCRRKCASMPASSISWPMSMVAPGPPLEVASAALHSIRLRPPGCVHSELHGGEWQLYEQCFVSHDRPAILSVTLEEEDPFCVNNSGGGLNATVDLDAEAVWTMCPTWCGPQIVAIASMAMASLTPAMPVKARTQ